MQIAAKTHEYEKQTLEPEKAPIQIDSWSSQGEFLPFNERTWRHDGYFNFLKESSRKRSDNLLSRMHSRGNENDRYRSSLSLKSGTMKIYTMQCKY